MKKLSKILVHSVCKTGFTYCLGQSEAVGLRRHTEGREVETRHPCVMGGSEKGTSNGPREPFHSSLRA